MKPALRRSARNAGLTLIEVLTVVAVMAIIASAGVVVTGGIREKVRGEKLAQDVGTLNRAIRLYEAHGGSLEGGTPHPWFILGKLKSRVAAEKVDEAPGLTGRLIDPRLQPVFMDSDGVASDAPRAVWDASERQFAVIYDNSIPGVKVEQFKLTDDTAEEEMLTQAQLSGIDSRELRAFGYAKDGLWVWDYEDRTGAGGPEPTEISLTLAPAPTPPGAPPGTTMLDPPLFSIPGGRYALSDFDLSLTLANPNDPAVSDIYYTTRLGSWVLYTGVPIVVQAETQISAITVTKDPTTWLNSEVAREAYATEPIQLEIALAVPASMNYAEAGGAMEPGSDSVFPAPPGLVTLENAADIPLEYQNSQRIKVMWTYDGSNPLSLGALENNPLAAWPPPNLLLGDPFGSGFVPQPVDILLPRWGPQHSLPVQVVAKSANHDVLLDSNVVLENIAIDKLLLPPPTMSAAGERVTLKKQPGLGNLPVGARIFYTTDGTFPGDNNGEPVAGTLYTGPFDIKTDTHPHCGNFTVIAKVYGPTGYGHWFDPSLSVSELIEIPPDAGTAERFGYNYSQSGISNYALVALGTLETKGNAKVFGNVGVGPDGTRSINNLSLSGSYDVDPLSVRDKDNAVTIADGSRVSPTTVNLNQAAMDAVSLSHEASVLSPTQTFSKIDKHTTITSTGTNVNVIEVEELTLTKERVLSLAGAPGDWFIINVTEKLKIKDGSIRGMGGVPASHIMINYVGTDEVNIGGDGTIQGSVLAVDAEVKIDGDVTIEGTVVIGPSIAFEDEGGGKGGGGGGGGSIEGDAVVSGDGNSYAFQCTAEGEAVGGPANLAPPDFSIPGGTYPLNTFDLGLNLIDLNEAGAATIYYAMNGGGWTKFTGAMITVSPEMEVEAYAATNDPGQWNDSAKAANTYFAGLAQLDEPVIATTAEKFDAGLNQNVTVTISNPNDPTLGTLRYRLLDRGGWMPYPGPFVLSAFDYLNFDAVIEAQVVSADPSAYADSDVATEDVLGLLPSPLQKPEVTLTTGTTSDPDGTTVTIVDPNPGGSSTISFVIVPVPSMLGCDIIHGNGYPAGTFTSYTGPIEIDSSTYPDGFAVITRAEAQSAAWIDSVYTVAYDPDDVTGLRGGHFDVDTTGSKEYAKTWVNWPGGGSTDDHIHEYDNQYDTVAVNLMTMPGRQLSLPDAVDAGEKFKILVVNANLSPSAHLAINQNPTSAAPYVTTYDDTLFAELPIYSLDGHAGTTKLSKLSLHFDEDAIVNGGLLPSNTGDVKGNIPGKAGEWRNGALTVQIVKVNGSGTPPGGSLDATKSNGDHGVGKGPAMMFEATVFWHWPGDSYHEATNLYVPGDQFTIVDKLDEAEEPLCAN